MSSSLRVCWKGFNALESLERASNKRSPFLPLSLPLKSWSKGCRKRNGNPTPREREASSAKEERCRVVQVRGVVDRVATDTRRARRDGDTTDETRVSPANQASDLPGTQHLPLSIQLTPWMQTIDNGARRRSKNLENSCFECVSDKTRPCTTRLDQPSTERRNERSNWTCLDF